MKYLIFNITVAASLVYLVAGEELGLKSAKEAVVEYTGPQVEQVQDAVTSLNAEDVRPLVAEMIAANQATKAEALSEDEIKAIVASAVAEALATQNTTSQHLVETSIVKPETIQPETVQTETVAVQETESFEETVEEAPFVSQVEAPLEITEAEILEEEELPLTVVETPTTHTPPMETGGLAEPERIVVEDTEQPVQMADASDAIQLAEGESLMTPQTRQKELDKLVNSLELMFLDLSN